ncbi:MAG TPA: type II toxin-antitoxin system VapB family antitoxin [Microvirga sp.]|jgi:antitoxin VapB|nr:type II toxin-antitoxin system VapB family antitoxin [Microvirga sp.]
MAVLIKDPETDLLVRKLAARTGETITEAVRKAAELRLSTLPPQRKRIDRDKLAEAQAYFSSLRPTNERLSDDEIVGYNDDGHFG